MRLLELFRGTGSVGEVARKRGWEVVSVDMDPKHAATHSVDVRKLKYKEMPIPDLVWASPPCTTYSLAAVWVKHREPGTGRALTPAAHEADLILKHTLKMLAYWSRLNPNLRFCIENPRGYMRHMPEMGSFFRTTVRYGDYGWPIRKPTDLWTNFPLHLPPPPPSPNRRFSSPIRVGPAGYRRKVREALGLKKGEPQATLLGRIPPALVRDLLDAMASRKRVSPRKRSRSL